MAAGADPHGCGWRDRRRRIARRRRAGLSSRPSRATGTGAARIQRDSLPARSG